MTTLKLRNPQLFIQACLINGKWLDATENLPVTNPATGAVIGHIPKMGASETQQTIDCSQAAFTAWSARPAKDRAALLRKWFELIIANKEDLAVLMTTEQGKPLSESRGEIEYAASFIEWFAEECKRVDGEVLQPHKSNQKLLVLKQPIGVCAAITPWNFPSAMITRKAAPALAAGCTIIIKPAENTPFSAMALGYLAQEAGIPAGVIQIITGDAAAIGDTLTSSPVVRKLTFTGSTQTGRLLMQKSSSTIKKLSLELGGNAPLIVFDDADISKAVQGILISKFRNIGQTCVCANRIYVHDKVYDEVCRQLVQAVANFRVGNGLDEGVTHGPLINEAAVRKSEQHVQDAVAKGAKVLSGGKRHVLAQNFFEPTVLSDVTDNMLICSEETFGPIAPLFRFHNDDEVLQRANDSIYGLAAYIFTESMQRTWHFSEALQYGMVGVNTGLISNESSPFGGIKQSGLGREGSRHGIDDYVEIKYVCVQL